MNKPGRNPAFSPVTFPYLGNHAASWSNEWGKNWAWANSETKEKPMSEWIPIADATIENHIAYYTTWDNGTVMVVQGYEILPGDRARIQAVMPIESYPEPYIAPAPPKPTHREWHFDGEPHAYTDGMPTLRTNAIVHAGPPVNGGLYVREVLPGDPTPEDIKCVVDDLKSIIEDDAHPDADLMREWIALLTGK